MTEAGAVEHDGREESKAKVDGLVIAQEIHRGLSFVGKMKVIQDNERQQFEKRAKLQLLLKEDSEYNYNTIRNRKSRLRSELQEDQTFHRDKYRKAETERSEERQA